MSDIADREALLRMLEFRAEIADLFNAYDDVGAEARFHACVSIAHEFVATHALHRPVVSPPENTAPLAPPLPEAKPPPVVLNTRDAAAFLTLSPKYLEKLRVVGGGPKYRRISPKVVRYTPEDLLDWVNAHPMNNTSEPA